MLAYIVKYVVGHIYAQWKINFIKQSHFLSAYVKFTLLLR